MPRVVKGRRCALVADLVVALVIVLGAATVGALLAVELADWRAARATHQSAGRVTVGYPWIARPRYRWRRARR